MPQKTLLERSLRLLDPTQASSSEVVDITIYWQGNVKYIKARVGKSEVMQADLEGAEFTARAQDFIVASADLVPTSSSSIVEPRKGDRIEWRRNSNPLNADDIFDVLPFDGGRCVEPMDAYGVLYRIHTKWRGTS